MSIADDINALIRQPPKNGGQNNGEDRPPIGDDFSVQEAQPQDGEGGGGGVASPITEISRETTTQTVWDDFNVWSVEVEAVTKLTCTDANGNPFVLILNP